MPKRLCYFMQRGGAALNMVLRIFLRVIAQTLQTPDGQNIKNACPCQFVDQLTTIWVTTATATGTGAETSTGIGAGFFEAEPPGSAPPPRKRLTKRRRPAAEQALQLEKACATPCTFLDMQKRFYSCIRICQKNKYNQKNHLLNKKSSDFSRDRS